MKVEAKQRIRLMFGNRCAYCGFDCELTADHLHPKSLGGANSMFNALPACKPCQNIKADLLWVDFIKAIRDKECPLYLIDHLIQRFPDHNRIYCLKIKGDHIRLIAELIAFQASNKVVKRSRYLAPKNGKKIWREFVLERRNKRYE